MEYSVRGPEAAKRQGVCCTNSPPDLMLQELNPGSSTVLTHAADAEWMVGAIDLCARATRPCGGGVSPLPATGYIPCRSWLLGEIQQSERILLVETQTEGTTFIAGSYLAPASVTWGILKPRQAVAFA